jgi:hypothetical protein
VLLLAIWSLSELDLLPVNLQSKIVPENFETGDVSDLVKTD